MKNPEKIKQGKKSREAGARFERKVRADLESRGWIVDRWSNQVELHKENSEEVSGIDYKGKFIYGKLVKAKSFMGRTRSNGFPDFVVFKLRFDNDVVSGYEIIGVEVKSNGKLNKIEKQKCQWLLKNKIFSEIFVASKPEFFKGKVKYTKINCERKAVYTQ